MNFKNALSILAVGFPLIALSLAAHAEGNEGVGGQNSVVCFNDPAIPLAIRDRQSPRFGQILDAEVRNSITSIESYDLYEARMPRGLTQTSRAITDIKPGESPRGYVERIAVRFEPYLPHLAELVRAGAGVFEDKRIIVRPAGLHRILDEADVGYIDAANCVVATMAAQYDAGTERLLQLDGRLFNHPKHSALSRAVLFLHESVYLSARVVKGHKNSRATRELVGWLINADPQSSRDLTILMSRLDMPGSGSFHNVIIGMAQEFFTAEVTEKLLKSLIKQAEAAGIPLEATIGNTIMVGQGSPRLVAFVAKAVAKIVEAKFFPRVDALKQFDAAKKQEIKATMLKATLASVVRPAFDDFAVDYDALVKLDFVIR